MELCVNRDIGGVFLGNGLRVGDQVFILGNFMQYPYTQEGVSLLTLVNFLSKSKKDSKFFKTLYWLRRPLLEKGIRKDT